ncbi:general secretion pathway protein LspH [Legionella israelensis]|uniref:Type II secretion system protein H n=1 Tax=Legionella israelensis TaxID=454 RepID=A0A0W0VH92_9GAMM|nr:type II secretion system minor pseudopilin GspH [Legionella israelensis]KTD19442.1 general secretion pathway protein LspH [Legionella israelensis]SCX92634.1 general secretion pathway protein H [Legionella israelensis DSM 19235]
MIEILVVLIIIGITISFALLAFGDFGVSRRISMATDQFANTLRLAQQQAILESSTLGIIMKNGSYQIYRFQPNKGWNPVSNKGVFAVQHFPPQAATRLKVSSTVKKGAPDIIINSSGDITPFTLNIMTKNQEIVKTLIGRHDGYLLIQDPPSGS